MKINFKDSRLKRVSSGIKISTQQIRKFSSSIHSQAKGHGSLSALKISDDPEEQDKEKNSGKRDSKLPDFDHQVIRLLKPKEKRAYQKLSMRTRRGFMHQQSGETGSYKGPAVKKGSRSKISNAKVMKSVKGYPVPKTIPPGSSGISLSPSGATPLAAGPSFLPASSTSAAASSAAASSAAPVSAASTAVASSAGAASAAASGASSAASAATATTTAATTTAAATATTTAATSATAAAASAAAGAATAGATAAVFAAYEGAKVSKKTLEKIKNSLKETARLKKQGEEALSESHQKTGSGKKKLPGAAGAFQEFFESFKQMAGLALGSFISSILSLLVSVVALPFLLIAVLAVVLFSIIFGTTSTAGSTQIVDVARAEASAWEENIGGYKYKNWYGANCDWCAVFVSWCADQCGYIDSGLFPKSASVATYRNFFDRQGNFYLKGTYTPKAGDLIIYGETGSSHIGIVADYDETSMILTTIEGNTGGSSTDTYHEGSRVREKQLSIYYSWIYGFCSPDYPIEVTELTGGTNIEQVFNYFVQIGYSQEASAGILGNLLRESGFTEDGNLLLNSTAGDGAVGIAQWSTSSLRNGFLSYASAQGEPWPTTSLKVQLDYLVMTLEQPGQWMFNRYAASHYPSSANISLSEFKRCNDVAIATTAFCACYERPNYNLSGLQKRIEYAQAVYRRYGNSSG